MWNDRNKAEEPSLDMTPLVDVVFLLIVFFMLSTTFIVLPGIHVDLPRASSERITLEPDEIVLSVDKDGRMYFGEKYRDFVYFRNWDFQSRVKFGFSTSSMG